MTYIQVKYSQLKYVMEAGNLNSESFILIKINAQFFERLAPERYYLTRGNSYSCLSVMTTDFFQIYNKKFYLSLTSRIYLPRERLFLHNNKYDRKEEGRKEERQEEGVGGRTEEGREDQRGEEKGERERGRGKKLILRHIPPISLNSQILLPLSKSPTSSFTHPTIHLLLYNYVLQKICSYGIW